MNSKDMNGTKKYRAVSMAVAAAAFFIAILAFTKIVAIGGFDAPGTRAAIQELDAGITGGVLAQDAYAGFEFSPVSDGYVTGLCGNFSGTRSINLYDADFNLLDSAPVSSAGQWSCAPTGAAAVRQGKNYFVAAEFDGGTVYYRYALPGSKFLPAAAGPVTVKAGVRQSLMFPFGTAAQFYPDRVFGLVDIRFSTEAPASSGAAAADVSAPRGTDVSAPRGTSIVKNCAGSSCVVCAGSRCAADPGADAPKNLFAQTCLNGYCYECLGGACGKNAAKGFRNGLFIKNCTDGVCVNCVNAHCGVVGTVAGRGSDMTKSDIEPWPAAVPLVVFGGYPSGSCGSGGIDAVPPAVLPKNNDQLSGYFDNGSKYLIDCKNGICRFCAGSECTTVSVTANQSQEDNAAASGETCPIDSPDVPPLNRPSVISAHSLSRCRDLMYEVGYSISCMPGPPCGPS